MAKNKFILYDDNGNFIEEFDSIIKFMKKYQIGSNVRVYNSIRTGSTFIFNKNHKDKRYRVEQVGFKTPMSEIKGNGLPLEDSKRIIYEVNSRACTIYRTTRAEMAEKYDYSKSHLSTLVKEKKPVAPGVYLVQNWYDTWEYL